MNIPSSEEIRIALQQSPKAVLAFLTSPQFTEAFDSIRVENKLHFDEAELLGNAITSIFLELRSTEEAPALIRQSLEQNVGAYDEVIRAVNEKIFKPYRKSLEGPNAQAPTPPKEVLVTKVGPRDILNRSNNTHAEKVEVDTLNGGGEIPEKNSPTYSTDPYREPIE